MKILAIDPGEKRIGLAISDPTGTIASPLKVIEHISRLLDAALIAQLAQEHGVQMILVGQAIGKEGKPTFEGRRAARLAAAIREQTQLPIFLWDESSSTGDARQARILMGVRREKRRGHMDDLAAVVILQSFLDSKTHHDNDSSTD